MLSTHPLNLGVIGVTGNSAANSLAKEADLIIGIGTRFTDFTTSSKQLFQNRTVSFLTINQSEFDANKLDAQYVIADAKTGLQELHKQLAEANYVTAYTDRSEEHTSELQSRGHLVCRLLLEKKKK